MYIFLLENESHLKTKTNKVLVCLSRLLLAVALSSELVGSYEKHKSLKSPSSHKYVFLVLLRQLNFLASLCRMMYTREGCSHIDLLKVCT